MLSPGAAAPRAHLAVRKQTTHSSPAIEGGPSIQRSIEGRCGEGSGKAVRTVQWYRGADRGRLLLRPEDSEGRGSITGT